MDVIKVAIVFMGAFLGAGFVSGAEVARFFAGKSPFGIILIAIIFAAGFIVYSFSARLNDFDSPYTRALVKIFSFFSLSATFAVANETGKVLFGIPLAPLTALAALALTSKQKFIKIGATASVAFALTAAVLAVSALTPVCGTVVEAARFFSKEVEHSEENRAAAIEKDFKPLCILELTIEHMSGKEAIELTKSRENI